MSAGTWSGIVTAVLIVLFVAVWIWAYSKPRESYFDAAARMPLDEENQP